MPFPRVLTGKDFQGIKIVITLIIIKGIDACGGKGGGGEGMTNNDFIIYERNDHSFPIV